MIEGTVLVLLLITASIFDLRFRRVPNQLVLLGLFLGVLISFIPGVSIGLVSAMLGFLLALTLLFPAYFFGWLGAGDVKLFGLVGFYLGPARVVDALLFISLTGGALALLSLTVDKFLKKHIDGSPISAAFIGLPGCGVKSMPYVIAITSGTFLTMLYPNFIART